ncbi:DUF1919 domain-containing protein [Trichococcus pasteurii]|uniref:DUF1919 domain-containing protein n=1 Tax=Trichococcus pasteurii TaxID=43064 RepID=A0A1W1II85_9LACT|nr:DUF1919 domain-containing protein [Trichococcus pasteurii]SFF09202.1 Uncharacterized protein, DUF1919 family [Trichococcus pasteurii]SLM52748.1 Hypothetical protein TPAS_2455 [Trichococcus pasteurii]SSB93629.1 Hypothetical protein TPAS_2455 [Trichococcus pasteurii]
MTYEGLRLRMLELWRKGFSSYRKLKLLNDEFTIISNNCWGGMIYESYGLKKQSPTVGLFFMADDYIKFISNLRMYLGSELKFIDPEMSKWKGYFANDQRFGQYPIGILNNEIEIFFLHYHSNEEAYKKWTNRCQRVCWERILIKFNDQNGCTAQHLNIFDKLPYKNKISFAVKKYESLNSVVTIKTPKKHTFIRASYEPFGKNRNIDINSLINKL